MQKKKTYFEQVPLDAIENLIKEEIRQPLRTGTAGKPNAITTKEYSSLAAAEDRSGAGS